jgi:hypothetical protein
VVEQFSGLVGGRFFGLVVGQFLELWVALVSAPGDGVARRFCGHSFFSLLSPTRIPCTMRQWEYQQWQQNQQQKQQQQKKQQR